MIRSSLHLTIVSLVVFALGRCTIGNRKLHRIELKVIDLTLDMTAIVIALRFFAYNFYAWQDCATGTVVRILG